MIRTSPRLRFIIADSEPGSGVSNWGAAPTPANVSQPYINRINKVDSDFKNTKSNYSKSKTKAEKTSGNLQDDLSAVNKAIREVEAEQTRLGKIRSDLSKQGGNTTSAYAKLDAEETKLDDYHTSLVSIRGDIQAEIDDAAKTAPAPVSSNTSLGSLTSSAGSLLASTPPPLTLGSLTGSSTGLTGSTTTTQVPPVDTGSGVSSRTRPPASVPLSYNIQAPKEAYFSTHRDFLKEMTFKGNSPSKVSRASQLWTSASNSKGMFVMSNPVPVMTPYKGFAEYHAQWGPGPNEWARYGFQFLYNPATVGMAFATAPNTDIGLQTSGQEKFNLMGTSGSFSTVTFQIIINRMFDMKYIDKNGNLSPNAADHYGESFPDTGTAIEIRNKGTMYDIEFLMRTLLGYTLNTHLRGNTADIGYLGAFPVELHLGKSMRYWGTVDQFSLNHTIFNEDMVPVFTSVDITFNRLVDPPNVMSNSQATRGVF